MAKSLTSDPYNRGFLFRRKSVHLNSIHTCVSWCDESELDGGSCDLVCHRLKDISRLVSLPQLNLVEGLPVGVDSFASVHTVVLQVQGGHNKVRPRPMPYDLEVPVYELPVDLQV